MKKSDSITEIRSLRWQDPTLSWGLVPTMGALHIGHLSLVQRSISENDRTAVSIFINPKQFNDSGDLEQYPRTLDADLALLAEAGVDLVFFPKSEEMYPPGFQTELVVNGVTKPLEGAHRPGHFEGVTLVVGKLFNIIQPTRAYFGQKDAQQTIVLKRMVTDLNFNLELVVCPTVREADGLAFSSRNVNLSQAERASATILYQTLEHGKRMIEEGERSYKVIKAAMEKKLLSEPLAKPEYVEITSLDTLLPLDPLTGDLLLSMAVSIGDTRLIDNFMVSID
ncbi:MAG: pantoate--beta-alanine ligase [Chloroflexota bacterium]